MTIAPPKIDHRDQQKVVEQVRELALYYCNKEWKDIDQIRSDKNADALIQIFSRMMEIIIQRLNKVPDKNFLTFLDMVGTRLSPPRVARAPLTFTMAKGKTIYGKIPKGMQVATVQTKELPALVFETESDITIIQPGLVKAASLSPGDEKWTDHSKALFKDSKEDVELFRGKTNVPHRLFLGHSKLFSFEEKKTIILNTKIDLQTDSPPIMPKEWEVKWYYFDETLSPKPLNVNKTANYNEKVANLLKSGSITFEPVAGIAEKTLTGFEKDKDQQKSWKSYWIFAELKTSVPGGKLPEIKSITASIDETSSSVLSPDFAFFNSIPLDMTKDFYPFGERPKFNDTFYIGSKDVFSKEGATITIGIELSQGIGSPDKTSKSLSLEFWDGIGWKQIGVMKETEQTIPPFRDTTEALTKEGNIIFKCPKIEVKEENGKENHWIRVRITGGNYGKDASYETTNADEISGTGTITSSAKDTIVKGRLTKFRNELRIGDSIIVDNQTRIVTYIQDDLTLAVNFAFDPVLTDNKTFIFKYGWIYKPSTYKPPSISTLTLKYSLDKIPLSILAYNDFTYRNHTYYLFNWDEVPVNNTRLIESLVWDFDVEWIRKAKIEKIARNKTTKETINISDGKNSISLILDDGNKKVAMTVNGVQTSEFVVFSENKIRFLYDGTKYPFAPFQPVKEKEPAFYLAFDQDIAKLPVTLFFPLLENMFASVVPLSFDIIGPKPEAFRVALEDVSNLRIGDFVEFRNPSGEIEKKSIMNILDKIITWEEPLSRDFSADGSTISLSLLDNPPVLAWEYWNGKNWSLLSVEDKTENLTKRDIIQFLAPYDIKMRYCFEEEKEEEKKEYYWIRARIDKGRYETLPKLRSVYTNTVWAGNLFTVKEEIPAGSNGKTNQVIRFSHSPVLSGQKVFVQEQSLTKEERQKIIDEEKSNEAVKDMKDDAGNITGYRVRWHEVTHFFSSGPHSRHYIIDRIKGTITFGDGERGMIPPAGKNNIVCSYQYGGGNKGNNAGTNSITKLKTAFPFVKSVINHGAADGGWDEETIERAVERGPQTIKHHERAVTFEDYEWLVRASPKIAKAKCLPAKDPSQQFKPGWVTIIIVPESEEPKPLPTQEFISIIKKDLEKKISTHLTDRSQINMIGPGYIKVGVKASVQFTSITEAKTIEGKIINGLTEFFHPLHGGPEKKGRDFGRDVYISEVYNVIKNTDGVDHVDQLYLNASIQIYKLKISKINPSVVYPKNSIVSIGKKLLFNWDEIPGNEDANTNLKHYLTQNFGINFGKLVNIEKTKNVIFLFTENNSISLRFDDDPTRAILTIDNIRTDELIVKVENGKTKIYDRAIFSLAERLSLDETDTLTVVGFKEGDNIILRNGDDRIPLLIRSVTHEITGDILECEPVRSETEFPAWSIVETFDKRIKSFITNYVPASSDIINFKVAALDKGDKMFLSLRDNPVRIDSSEITGISDKVDTIFIDDNYLVYSGTHLINENGGKGLELPDTSNISTDEIYNIINYGKKPEFPYLININTGEIHDLNNWKKNCHLTDIRKDHRNFIGDLDMIDGYDYCRWCFGAELSKR